MSNPNTSEKSVYLDREEHVHKGELGAKRVVLYSYDSATDTLLPYDGTVGTSNLGNQITTITSSTAETTIVTAVADTYLDLYGLIITNTSATASGVTIKDATGGTTRMVLYVPATDTRGFMLPAESAHKQATLNNNWTATCGTSVASIVITALYKKRT